MSVDITNPRNYSSFAGRQIRMRTSARVLLATNRPSVYAFFLEQNHRNDSPLTFVQVAVAEDEARAHANDVGEAMAAIVDMGADPDAGVRVCSELRALRPDLHIVAIVCCSKPTLAWHVHELMDQRVDDILDAQATPDDIFAALGNTSAHVTRVQLRGHYAGIADAIRTLKLNDRRLLELVARGWSDDELGADLGLSARTVRRRLERLRDVLCVGSREELAAWAGAHGLYQPPVLASDRALPV